MVGNKNALVKSPTDWEQKDVAQGIFLTTNFHSFWQTTSPPPPPTNSQKRTSSMLVTYLGFPLGSFCAPLVMTVENEKSLSGRLNPKVKAGRQLCHAYHSASHNTYKILVLKHPKWMVISCKVPAPSSVQALKTLL